MSLDAHYDRNQRKLYEYEPDSKLPENAPKDVLEKYREAEEKFYDEVNQHNSVTAEFQDEIKMKKLKALTPEKAEEINKLIDEINKIAKKYEVDAEIKKLSLVDLQSFKQTGSTTQAESGPQTVNYLQTKMDTNKKETQEIPDYFSNQIDILSQEINQEQEQGVKIASRSPYKYFWDNKRKTVIFVFVVIPVVSTIIVFCFLPLGTGTVIFGGISLLDLFAFWLTSKIYTYCSNPADAIVPKTNELKSVVSEVQNEKVKSINT